MLKLSRMLLRKFVFVTDFMDGIDLTGPRVGSMVVELKDEGCC